MLFKVYVKLFAPKCVLKTASNDLNSVKRFYIAITFSISEINISTFFELFRVVFLFRINHTQKINGYLLKSVTSCKIRKREQNQREQKRMKNRLF